MSRPGGPYRDERYPPQQRQYPQDGYQQGYPQRGHPDQAYGQGYGADQGYQQGGYQQGGYDQGYDRGYGQPQEQYRPQRPAAERPRPSAPPPEPERRGFRVPGLGLLLSLLGLVVQVLCLFVLPWFTGPTGNAQLPEIWDLLRDVQAGGFGSTYLILFSYPLAALGILLSLVAVIESVAMKVIWAILTIIGLAVLVLRYGLGPFGEMVSSDKPLEFTNKELVVAIIALAALVLVIFMLKMAMSTFRRIAGLVLLVVAGVHIAALRDMTGDLTDLGIGAYGPALGYVLAAAAAFVGPPKVT